MKKHLLSRVAALCLLGPAALLGLPSTAATAAEAGGPQARGLEVNADSGVAPGSPVATDRAGGEKPRVCGLLRATYRFRFDAAPATA